MEDVKDSHYIVFWYEDDLDDFGYMGYTEYSEDFDTYEEAIEKCRVLNYRFNKVSLFKGQYIDLDDVLGENNG